jgi:GTP-binding protein
MSEALAPSLRVRPATVAVVGRPNVGKSALFNRLLGQRLAIVEDTPGVTRDRLYALADWQGRTFTLVDTGGIDTEVDPDDTIARGTQAQAESAARDADVIVFVVDAQDGLTPVDSDVANILRRNRKPVILVANKIESPKHAASVHAEFGGLGFGEVYGVSALHSTRSSRSCRPTIRATSAKRSCRWR